MNPAIVFDQVHPPWAEWGPASFDLDWGRLVVVTGPADSGKTTLLHVACGLLAPSSGTVTSPQRWFGLVVTKPHPTATGPELTIDPDNAGRALIIADDPTEALDDVEAGKVRDLLTGLAESGAVVLAATHDPLLVSRADDEIGIGGH